MHRTVRRIAIVLILLGVMADKGLAQEINNGNHWYAGVEGATSVANSTASSFGADKTRMGFNAGLFVGRTLSTVFSIELAANFGKSNLSPRSCCFENNQWFGCDGNRYVTPVLDMDGTYYSDLLCKISTQSFVARLPINILKTFTPPLPKQMVG